MRECNCCGKPINHIKQDYWVYLADGFGEVCEECCHSLTEDEEQKGEQ